MSIESKIVLLVSIFLAFLLLACRESRHGEDYHFSDPVKNGWYFIIYEQSKAPALPILEGRVQIVFNADTRLLATSSRFEPGTAKDRYFIDKREVRSSELGGVYPCYIGKVALDGSDNLLEYKQIYIGDIKDVAVGGDPTEIMKQLFLKNGNSSNK